MMTIDQAAILIRETSGQLGEALPQDICVAIATRLLSPPQQLRLLSPGDVARYHRERYEE